MLSLVQNAIDLPPLPSRVTDTHKGEQGTVLVIAGSRPYPGAAALCALGAARMGAGYVRLAVPDAIVDEVLPVVPSAVIARLPHDRGVVTPAAADVLAESLSGADAVVAGPGLSTGAGPGAVIAALLTAVRVPLVLDADALNALVAGAPDTTDMLCDREAPTVLTPHPGEFARLTGWTAPRTADERVDQAMELARRVSAIVVLKGAGSVTTDGDRVHVERAGNPGMAKAGMGDVLAGALASLTARLDDPTGAAALAVHLHAVAGDLATADLGAEAVLPTDVAERLGRAARGDRAPD